MLCAGCQIEKDHPRLPRGWKRFGEATWCATCWHARYVVRAITIPIAGPVVEGGPEERQAAWATLREELRAGWRACTQVANWAVRELAKAEAPRTAAQERLGPAPRVYLYPGARAVAPELATGSVVALLRAIEAKYRSRRLAAIWRCAESLPSYRYPTPMPIHVNAWKAVELSGGALGVAVRLVPGEEGRRWTLRLRGGPGFRRQMGSVRALLVGEAHPCELVLMEKVTTESAHRTGGETRGAGGGRRRNTTVMAKLVMWLPRREAQKAESVLRVRTCGDRLWAYAVDGEEERYLHADHVRRWIAEEAHRLDRSAHDLKHEKRWPRDVREQAIEAREPWMLRHHRRLDSFAHEATAMLVGYARRRVCAQIEYDDHDRGFFQSFPWHQLRERLTWKAEEYGISVVFASGAAVDKTPEPLAVAEGALDV